MTPPSSLRCEVCGTFSQANASLCLFCNRPLFSFIPQATTSLFLDGLFYGRYQVLAKIGAGGFGAVYKALDTQNQGHLVAIKEVKIGQLEPGVAIDACEAFRREVSFLSHLHHNSLPHIYEYCGSAEHLYLVMDYIEGETLEVYEQRAHTLRQYLPLSETLTIGIQLCNVLNYLHTQQPPIVFRDLKPANIMRTCQGQLYLIDFGIARYFKPGQSKDTVALGTLGYAAPEQYGKAQTTPQTDIYSLGAVLHQLLTLEDPSQAPFHFTPLQVNSSSSIIRLGTLIQEMVEMEENKRPSSVAQIKQELEHISKIWNATMLNFWQPGSKHTHNTTIRPYTAGYKAIER